MNDRLSISKYLHVLLLISGLCVLIWSGIHPRDRLTWLLEVMPAIMGVVLLITTYRRFRFSNLVYVLIWIHALILMVGGHWTYAEMPLFNWIRDTFDLQRNYYDRLGHLAQGFIPAIIVRELLVRTSPLRSGGWLSVLTVACCLAISAAYELIEAWCAILLKQAADQFLATQGDPWDTQWDMFLAFIGAVLALLVLRHLHDRSMNSVANPHDPPIDGYPSGTR